MTGLKTFEMEDLANKEALNKYVEEFSEWVQAFCPQQEIGYMLCLTLDELFMNIIEHGYQNQSGWVRVASYAFTEEQVIAIVVADKAHSFDFMRQLTDKKDSEFEALKPHVGLQLVKHFVDQVQYRRLVDGNQIILYKYYGSA